MTPADLQACTAFVDRLLVATGPDLREIALLSPNYAQVRLVRRAYPKARLHILSVDDWDIRDPFDHGFDLVVASNVLHYISDAEAAIANLMRSSSFVWIQDLIDRERGKNGFASDGDCMRYSFAPHFKSAYDGAFDLSLFARHVVDFHEYAAEQSSATISARHFTMVLEAGSLKAGLPAKPYAFGRQWWRLARLGAGHLRRSVMRPLGDATTLHRAMPDLTASRDD